MILRYHKALALTDSEHYIDSFSPLIKFVILFRTFCSSTSRPDDQTETSRQTYDADEVEKFSKLSEDWWDEYGHFQALHSMNALRVPLIRDGMSSGADNTSVQHLKGLKIVDVGCGGGILSEVIVTFIVMTLILCLRFDCIVLH